MTRRAIYQREHLVGLAAAAAAAAADFNQLALEILGASKDKISAITRTVLEAKR